MREIIFRGKRIDNGEWVLGVPFTVEDEGTFIIDNCRTLDFTNDDTDFKGCKVIPETIGQFTGISDVNGNKIFEGDILLFPFDLGQAYVVYDGIRFAVKSEGSEAIDYEPSEVLKQCEIIGNIHD